jgi:sulfite reductase (NADPH) flavoprotein alpha-component
MHLQQQEPAGGAEEEVSSLKQFTEKSSSLPFGQPVSFYSISGPTYVTAQTLIQQVAYALSDKIFSYSPESFDLDAAVKNWSASNTKNANGYTTQIAPMQTRSGAGSIALGYMFSKDFDLAKRHIPQSLLASSSSLHHLRSTLDQLSLLYSVANPFVAHVAAVDYAPRSSSGLVTDYASALTVVEELGLGLVSSSSAYESQHMSLFSTLLSSVLPTLHIYDGINVGRETLRVIDVLDQAGLKNAYTNVSKELSGVSKRADAEVKLVYLLHAFNSELGTAYELFEYHGHSSPETVLVVFGTVEASLASQVATKLSDEGAKVGVLNVRVYRPFVEEAFLSALPASVRTIAVLGQVLDQSAVADQFIQSSLYRDVLAAAAFADEFSTSPSVVDLKYAREETFTPTSMAAVFRQLTSKSSGADDRIQLLGASQVEQYTFWDLEESTSATAPSAISKLLSNDSANNIFLTQTHDNYVQGGTVRTDIRNSKKSIEASYPIEEADVAVVGDEKLLKDIGILKNIKSAGKLIVKLSDVKDEDLEKKLSSSVRRDIQLKGLHLFVLDPTLSSTIEKNDAAECTVTALAFLKVARPDLLETGVEKLAAINGNADVLKEALTDLDKALRQVEIPASWAAVKANAEIPDLPRTINSNSFTGFAKEEVELPSLLHDWQAAAKGLAFKEAYSTQASLRPDLSVKSFEIHVKENRRLTPLTYDRNIFHIEFDLGQSGLKYNIGEALGIHAENNVDEVNEFMKFYGLDPEEVVEVPSREDPSVLDTRTVFQSLMQNINIFGKPPKRFYEALAEFASDENEKKELLTLGGPEGANEFKRRAEVDTITYADILLEFQSAHPSFHDIARIVSPMKRREYSIASSQMVNPTSVALMIVVVGWVDPKGRDRFGQATRYLSQLPIGAAVTVSVKPSVMKLPTKDISPLIMAGLGTGLAPFRAFVQYRAMQKAQGKEIGSILLYMGSRHQREEYLYGEEWEAYQDAGVITLLGRAFSRDQPQKIYIQDRMRQSMSNIIKAYIKEEGAFYLCGPTWPVPGVTEVLQEAIARDAKFRGKKVDPRKEIERLKEDLRYVLEVY